jgi:hypothetical protein
VPLEEVAEPGDLRLRRLHGHNVPTNGPAGDTRAPARTADRRTEPLMMGEEQTPGGAPGAPVNSLGTPPLRA